MLTQNTFWLQFHDSIFCHNGIFSERNKKSLSVQKNPWSQEYPLDSVQTNIAFKLNYRYFIATLISIYDI